MHFVSQSILVLSYIFTCLIITLQEIQDVRTAQAVGQVEFHREMEEVKINIETLKKTIVGTESQQEEQTVRLRDLQSSSTMDSGMIKSFIDHTICFQFSQ